MGRIKMTTVALAFAMMAGSSFSAGASWQGTWHYYSDEGVLVGSWTAGCGAADGRWGIVTAHKTFIQGCKAES